LINIFDSKSRKMTTKLGSTNQIARRPGQVTCKVGQVTRFVCQRTILNFKYYE